MSRISIKLVFFQATERQDTAIGDNAMTKTVAKPFFILFFVILSFLLILCVALGPLNDLRIKKESLRATAEAEAILTDAHGKEVRDVIENFELQWHSLEAYTDPNIQSGVATGQYLECYSNARGGISERPVLYTVSASVENVRVIEYSPQRFKAVADVIREMARAVPGGEILGVESSIQTCGVYVFVREDNIWKLLGFFNVGLPYNDVAYAWDYAPAWEKEIIGELPGFDPCGWISKSR